MTREVYEFDICRADCAADLHHLTDVIRDDVTLDQEEKDGLLELIRLKFCRLNRAAGSNPEPRW